MKDFFKKLGGREKYLLALFCLCFFIAIGGFFFYSYWRQVSQKTSSSQSFDLEALKKELETRDIKTRKITEEDRWQTYSDEALGFSLKYLASWHQIPKRVVGAGTRVSFTTFPLTQIDDNWTIEKLEYAVYISIESRPNSLGREKPTPTLEDWVKNPRRQKTTISGLPAYRLPWAKDSTGYEGTTIFVIKEDTLFTIVAAIDYPEAKQVQIAKELMEEIIRSFRLL